MARPTPPDDGNPARLIATMVGIVGILLLGSLAWSAVGALFSALGEATASLTNARPTPGRLAAIVGTVTAVPTPRVTATAAVVATLAPTVAATVEPTPSRVPAATPTPAPVAQPTATSVAQGRAPWILLPQPEPGGKISGGSTTIEARGRGDAPITSMRLELDGAPIASSFEQRDNSTWRVFASTKVSPGQHAVRATVVDDKGRTGGFRWTFDVAP